MGNSAASAAVIGVHLLLFIAATPQDAQSTRGAVELDCGKLEMRGINSRKWGEMILKTHSCLPYVSCAHSWIPDSLAPTPALH